MRARVDARRWTLLERVLLGTGWALLFGPVFLVLAGVPVRGGALCAIAGYGFITKAELLQTRRLLAAAAEWLLSEVSR